MNIRNLIAAAVLCLPLSLPATGVHARMGDEMLKVSLQKRIPSDLDSGAFLMINEIQHLNPTETAIIIHNMHDTHWCRATGDRIADLAPYLNKVIKHARELGLLIVHAPGGCMEYYKDHPARKLGNKYRLNDIENKIGSVEPEKGTGGDWPLTFYGEGCDDEPLSKPGIPWTRQIVSIEIANGDAITESGIEAGSLFSKRGIKNVILAGTQQFGNMINGSLGLHNLKRLGMNVVLMRDLTDFMCDSGKMPHGSHYTGNSLLFEYIESHMCPTMVSTGFTGSPQFRFDEDTRPVVAFILAESEYRANQRLPEFAHHLLVNMDVNCEFALGKAVMKGEGRHNIENLQILDDADLAVLFIRRRGLSPDKMNRIREYVTSGRPVLGIRTASHAFDPKLTVPSQGGDVIAAGEELAEHLSTWTEFDEEVLGGNYQGHHGHLKEGTTVSIVPGMEHHSLLRGVDPDGFISPNWLYKNRPLRSDHVQVLLTGTIPGQPHEPVFWVNRNAYGKAVYTSLGHWDDWEIESFYHMMLNSVEYLLNPEN